jgi:hypothetical protein
VSVLLCVVVCCLTRGTDARYWATQEHYGELGLFWQLSHRWLENQLHSVLHLANDKTTSVAQGEQCTRVIAFFDFLDS